MIDIIVGSCKTEKELEPLREEIENSAVDFSLHMISNPDKSASQNRNIGLDRSVSDYIVMIDDDMTGFKKGWNQQLVSYFENRKDLGIISGRLLNPDGLLGYMNSRNWDMGPELVNVSKAPTAMIAIRNIGLRFDERYIGSGFEDTDFCLQMINDGYDIAIANRVQAIHTHEQKNQLGENWKRNHGEFKNKWKGHRPRRLIAKETKHVVDRYKGRHYDILKGRLNNIGFTEEMHKILFSYSQISLYDAMHLFLAAKRVNKGTILEIGGGFGGSMLTMFFAKEGNRLITIDPFEPYTEIRVRGGKVRKGVTEGDKYKFKSLMMRYHVPVELIELDATTAASKIEDNSCDLIFIDGNHSYQYVVDDLRNYWPKLKLGGELIGHDYNMKFPDLIKAVDEFEKEMGLEIRVPENTNLYICRKDKE